MERDIIVIDEEKCTGCGVCIPNCPEGALQVIDGKCHLISDLLCDGLGACVGHCPEDAMTVEKREAEPYDEVKVMEDGIVPKGPNVIRAHLEHLRDHGQTTFLQQALDYLREHDIPNPLLEDKGGPGNVPCACPGSKMMDFNEEEAADEGGDESGTRVSQLRQWPVQLHLVSPLAPYYQEKDVILSADCVAYTVGDFHKDFLKGKSLAIACPKLDSNKEVYIDKITALIDEAKINTLTVMIMEVPCCSGLLMLAKQAAENAERKVPIKCITVSLKGEILEEKWL
jgi:ferredoxin